jgi:hypothetical protein
MGARAIKNAKTRAMMRQHRRHGRPTVPAPTDPTLEAGGCCSDQGLVRGSTRTQALSPATSNNAKRRASFWVRNTPPMSPSLSFATQYPRAFSAISKWCGVNTARGAKLDMLSCQYCYSSCSYEQADIIGLTPLGFERPLKGLPLRLHKVGRPPYEHRARDWAVRVISYQRPGRQLPIRDRAGQHNVAAS